MNWPTVKKECLAAKKELAALERNLAGVALPDGALELLKLLSLHLGSLELELDRANSDPGASSADNYRYSPE